MSKKLTVVIKPYVQTVGAHRGGKIQIDARLPKKDRAGVIVHERKEDKLQHSGDKYESAHRQANKAEKKAVGAKRYHKETRDADRLYRHNLSKKSKTARGKCATCGKINCTGH
jgi:hypothetical protein